MIKKKLVTACASAVLSAFSSAAFADASSDEVTKQIAKLIGDAISSRVASVAVTATAAPSAEKNNVWGSYTNVDVNVSGFSGTRTDLFLGGYDRDLTDKFVAGIALSSSDTKPNGKSWGLTPYVAYRFTDSVFGVVRLDYQRADFDFSGGAAGITFSSSSKTDIYALSGSINGAWRPGNAAIKGRLEISGSDADTSTTTAISCAIPIPGVCPATTSTSSKSTTTVYVADGEIGYYFMPRLYGFVGLQLSDTNRSNSYQASARIGLEQGFAKDSAVFAKYEQQVDNNAPSGVSIDVKSFTVGLRVRF